MFGLKKKDISHSNAKFPQSEIDASGINYEEIINGFAQIDGISLNKFIYNRGRFNPEDNSLTFYYFAEEELDPEEAEIIEEAFAIMGKKSSVVKVSLSATDEIKFDIWIK